MERFFPRQENRYFSAFRQLREVTDVIREQSALSPQEFLDKYEKEVNGSFPGSTRKAQAEGAIPVMICARNEVGNIGRTLYGLSRQEISVQPVVVDNGSTDGTGVFSRRLGAQVITEGKPGLLNALRSGFNYFKNLNYSGPILLTDSDTVPISSWAETMVKHAQNTLTNGGEATGRTFHYDFDGKSHILKNAILTGGAMMLDRRALKKGEYRAHGQNSIIMTDSEGKILDQLSRVSDELLHSDGYGTDSAVSAVIEYAGGNITFCSDASALVVASGRRYPHMKDVIGLALKREKTKARVYKDWVG
jgi:glycosyltransferase involved in cell wall biosynthesis